MKKVLWLCLLLGIFVSNSCNPLPPDPPGGDDPAQVQHAEWTVLIQLAVDNNIDFQFDQFGQIVSNYLATLESVKGAPSNTNINIVILMDAYDQDSQNVGYTSRYKDGYYVLSGADFNSDRIVNTGEINSGNVNTVKDFITWATLRYPANHYMLSIFNHGSGFDDQNIDGTFANNLGIAFDDGSSDSLSHSELAEITAHLKNAIGKNIDLFYPYACLMGGVELAYEIRNNADYLLSSEELFPADYWSYEALSLINSHPDISGAEIGQSIISNAYDYFTSLSSPREFTFSLVDLSQMDGLYNALNTFSLAALADINSDTNLVLFYEYANESTYHIMSPGFYYMDLGQYMYTMSTNALTDVQTEAQAVLSQLELVVVKNTNYQYPDTTGLTIYHNVWGSSALYSEDLYKAILDFGDNSWADLMTVMNSYNSSVMSADSYEPDDSIPDAKNIFIDASAQQHTIHLSTDIDYLKLDLSGISGTTNISIETHYWRVDSDTVLFLYDAAGNQLASNDDSTSFYSKIEYAASAGIYYIKVMLYANSGTGDYTVDVKTTVPSSTDIYEPDDSSGTATAINIDGGVQTHTLHQTSDLDWMYFDATSGVNYTVITTSPNGDILDSSVYSASDLVYPIGTGWVGYNINFACSTTGRYYIQINSYAGGTGEYGVEVKTGTYLDYKRRFVKKK